MLATRWMLYLPVEVARYQRARGSNEQAAVQYTDEIRGFCAVEQ